MPTRPSGISVTRIAALLTEAVTQLENVGDSPRLDAELLLSHVLHRPRSYLHAHPEQEPEAAAQAEFRRLLAARRHGEPVAYLTAEREFWSLPLKVTPATLIPRPETELLVEAALQRIPKNAGWRILDLGTGSGAIALAIARERPRSRITATDLSAAAVAVARENAAGLQLDNVEFLEGDWFQPLIGERFHLIVSNPPYIPASDPHLDSGDVRFEPRLALVAGGDGLDSLRRIATAAADHLQSPGWLLLEHGYDQAVAVRDLLHAQGGRQIQSLQDLQGHERVTLAAMNH